MVTSNSLQILTVSESLRKIMVSYSPDTRICRGPASGGRWWWVSPGTPCASSWGAPPLTLSSRRWQVSGCRWRCRGRWPSPPHSSSTRPQAWAWWWAGPSRGPAWSRWCRSSRECCTACRCSHRREPSSPGTQNMELWRLSHCHTVTLSHCHTCNTWHTFYTVTHVSNSSTTPSSDVAVSLFLRSILIPTDSSPLCSSISLISNYITNWWTHQSEKLIQNDQVEENLT